MIYPEVGELSKIQILIHTQFPPESPVPTLLECHNWNFFFLGGGGWGILEIYQLGMFLFYLYTSVMKLNI